MNTIHPLPQPSVAVQRLVHTQLEVKGVDCATLIKWTAALVYRMPNTGLTNDRLMKCRELTIILTASMSCTRCQET